MFQLQLFLGLHEFVVFVMGHQRVSIRACLFARFNMHRFTDGCGPSTNSGQITQASDASQCIANSARQLKVHCVTGQHLPHDTDYQAATEGVDASEAPACLRAIRACLTLCFLVCSGARAGRAVAPAGATGCSCVATTLVPQAFPDYWELCVSWASRSMQPLPPPWAVT